MEEENIFAIICFILAPLIAFGWCYMNCLIVEGILWLQDKWNDYQINRMTKQIQKMHQNKNVRR